MSERWSEPATVGMLLDALAAYPRDMPIGLMVNGQSYYAPCHHVTHAPLREGVVTLHYGGGATEDVLLIGNDIYFPGYNGYRPEIKSTRAPPS